MKVIRIFSKSYLIAYTRRLFRKLRKRVDERIEQIEGRKRGLYVVHLPMRWIPTTFSSGPWQITLYFVMGFSPGPPCQFKQRKKEQDGEFII